MKIRNQDSYDQMKYMVHQNKYKRQRPKTKGIVNYCLDMLTKNWVIQNLKE